MNVLHFIMFADKVKKMVVFQPYIGMLNEVIKHNIKLITYYSN